MPRLALVILLLGGTFLGATWVISPASSAPQSRSGQAGAPADPEANEPRVDPIRLDAPRAPAPDYAPPRRDPFSFQRRTEPVVRSVAPSATAPVREPVRLPSLVAIVRDGALDGRDAYRASFSIDGFNVTLVRAGETIGGFSIVDVGPDFVRLRDVTHGDIFRLALH